MAPVLADFFGEVLRGALIGAVAGLVAGVIGVPIVTLLMPAPHCPFCKSRLSKWSRFQMGQPALWGRCICPGCQRVIARKDLKKSSA